MVSLLEAMPCSNVPLIVRLGVKLVTTYGAAFGSARNHAKQALGGRPRRTFVKSTVLSAIGPIDGPSSLKTSSWPMSSGAAGVVAVLVGGRRRQHHQIGRRRASSTRPGWSCRGARSRAADRASHCRWLDAHHEHRIARCRRLADHLAAALSDSTTDWPVAVSVRPEAPPGVEQRVADRRRALPVGAEGRRELGRKAAGGVGRENASRRPSASAHSSPWP